MIESLILIWIVVFTSLIINKLDNTKNKLIKEIEEIVNKQKNDTK